MKKFDLGSIKLLSLVCSGLLLIMSLAQIILSDTRRRYFALVEPYIGISLKTESITLSFFSAFLIAGCIFGIVAITWSAYGMLVLYGIVLFIFTLLYLVYGIILIRKSNNEELALLKLYEIRQELIKYRRPHPLYILQKLIGCCGIDDFTDLWLLDWYFWEYYMSDPTGPRNYTGPLEGNPKDEGIANTERINAYPLDPETKATLQDKMWVRYARNVTAPVNLTTKIQIPTGPYWQAFNKIENNTDDDYDDDYDYDLGGEDGEGKNEEIGLVEIRRKKRKTKIRKIVKKKVLRKRRKGDLQLPLLKKKPQNEKELFKLTNYLNKVVADYAHKKAENFFTHPQMREAPQTVVPGYMEASGEKFIRPYKDAGWLAWSQGIDWYIAHIHFWNWKFNGDLTLYPTRLPTENLQNWCPANFDFQLVQTCCKNPSKNCSRSYQKGEIYYDGCGRKLLADWRRTLAEFGAMLVMYSFMLIASVVINMLYIAGVQEHLYF